MRIATLLVLILAMPGLSGCVVGTAVGVAGAVVGTGVKVGAKTAGAVVGVGVGAVGAAGRAVTGGNERGGK